MYCKDNLNLFISLFFFDKQQNSKIIGQILYLLNIFLYETYLFLLKNTIISYILLWKSI